jgi:hypothetical protein
MMVFCLPECHPDLLPEERAKQLRLLFRVELSVASGRPIACFKQSLKHAAELGAIAHLLEGVTHG